MRGALTAVVLALAVALASAQYPITLPTDVAWVNVNFTGKGYMNNVGNLTFNGTFIYDNYLSANPATRASMMHLWVSNPFLGDNDFGAMFSFVKKVMRIALVGAAMTSIISYMLLEGRLG